MVATGFISMWVSNTATAVMMLPIGLSVLLLVNKLRLEDAAAKGEEPGEGVDPHPEAEPWAPPEAVRSNFGTALMLGIAYAASIGSLATIIGTPPNALLAAHMSQDFGDHHRLRPLDDRGRPARGRVHGHRLAAADQGAVQAGDHRDPRRRRADPYRAAEAGPDLLR